MGPFSQKDSDPAFLRLFSGKQPEKRRCFDVEQKNDEAQSGLMKARTLHLDNGQLRLTLGGGDDS